MIWWTTTPISLSVAAELEPEVFSVHQVAVDQLTDRAGVDGGGLGGPAPRRVCSWSSGHVLAHRGSSRQRSNSAGEPGMMSPRHCLLRWPSP